MDADGQLHQQPGSFPQLLASSSKSERGDGEWLLGTSPDGEVLEKPCELDCRLHNLHPEATALTSDEAKRRCSLNRNLSPTFGDVEQSSRNAIKAGTCYWVSGCVF